MPSFIDEFTRELLIELTNDLVNSRPDNPEELASGWTPSFVQYLLTTAAANTIAGTPDQDRLDITLRREIEVRLEDLMTITVIDLGGGYQFSLFPEDVAVLRALLLSWDESRPPQVGDPLTMGCKLPDGRVVSEVVEELLDQETPA
jgi:hypothetical protein